MTEIWFGLISGFFIGAACTMASRLRRAQRRLAASEAHVMFLSHAFNVERAYVNRLEERCKEITVSRAEWIRRWKEGEFELRDAGIVPDEAHLERL